MTDNSSNNATARRRAQRLAGNVDTNEAIAYEDIGGATRNVQGDDEGPWLKTPPFTETPPAEYLTSLVLPTANAYHTCQPIDVQDSRLLVLFVEYTAASGDNDGQLSIIPQVSREDAGDTFMAIPVIDPSLTLVTCTGFSAQFGSRSVYPAELRTEALADATQVFLPLPFDVAPYSRIRFLVGELSAAGDPGAIRLGYSRSQ